jgi:putative ABC transport system permease protein
LWGMALAGPRRVPGRALVAVVSLAVSTAALVALASIVTVFDGQVTGTLLGEAVTVQAREADIIAVVAMMLLSVVAVADVLYLNLRDRSEEFAALQATGWTDAHLARLMMTEGAVLGLVGGAAGALAGGAAIGGLAGGIGLLAQMAPLLAAATGLGVLLAVAVSAAPAYALRRQSTLQLLTAE